MSDPQPDIRVFKPFEEAFEWMKTMLFRPFNLSKWCVIGFAAFLSSLSTGGFHFNFGNWGNSSSSSPSGFSWRDTSPWILLIIGVAVVLVGAVLLALWWVGCRGRFIFTDCVVRNRAAIAEPWRNYRREGNSLFLFSLAAIVILLLFGALCVVPVVLIWIKTQTDGFSWPGLVALLILIPLFILLVVCWAMALHFMVPLMYRQRCLARVAFGKVISLAWNYPGDLLLYVLFSIGLAVATGVLMVALMCATCCLVVIPYVGTVMTLPVLVVYHAFLLFYLRQFGSDYDVWEGFSPFTPPARVSAPEPPALPSV